MKIDFDTVETTIIPHFNGGEKQTEARMLVDDLGRIMHGRLIPGASIGLHQHTKNYEVLYVLSGTGMAICDGVEEPLVPGNAHYCPKGSSHTLINNGSEDLVFFAVVPNA